MKRYLLLAILLSSLLVAGAAADNQTVTLASPTGKPNFISFDTLVVNLNAVAGFSYYSNANGGSVTIAYLNGTTSVHGVRLNADQWTKVQADIVSTGNK